jgi:hypothetical protein
MNGSCIFIPRSTEKRLKSIARVQGLTLPDPIAGGRATHWTEEQFQEIVAALKPFAARVAAVESLIRELNYYRRHGVDG